jgi:hypothetical protein
MDFDFFAHVLKENDGSWRRQSLFWYREKVSTLTGQFTVNIRWKQAGRITQVFRITKVAAASWERNSL